MFLVLQIIISGAADWMFLLVLVVTSCVLLKAHFPSMAQCEEIVGSRGRRRMSGNCGVHDGSRSSGNQSRRKRSERVCLMHNTTTGGVDVPVGRTYLYQSSEDARVH